MQLTALFSQHDIERLFLTYKRNPINYTKIKQEIVGSNLQEGYQRVRRSSYLFFGAVTFIIIISSSFSLVAEHYDSLIALWMIWGVTTLLFAGWMVFNYRNTYATYSRNENFFDHFELIAQSCRQLAPPLKKLRCHGKSIFWIGGTFIWTKSKLSLSLRNIRKSLHEKKAANITKS